LFVSAHCTREECCIDSLSLGKNCLPVISTDIIFKCLPDIIRQVTSRRMRWAGHVERMGEERNVYKVLVGKPEGKRLLGRPRRRWEDGIRMDLREIGLGGVNWIRLAQDRGRWRSVASAVMNLRVLAPQS
jgi:hypothetical protein